MYLHKISAALLMFIILISGIYTGSTAAYVHSVSATCVNTFTGEAKAVEETTVQNTTEQFKPDKKSPETGNKTLKYALVSAFALSLFLTIIFKYKMKKGFHYG